MTDAMWAVYGIKVGLLMGVVMLVVWGGRAVRWIRCPFKLSSPIWLCFGDTRIARLSTTTRRKPAVGKHGPYSEGEKSPA